MLGLVPAASKLQGGLDPKLASQFKASFLTFMLDLGVLTLEHILAVFVCFSLNSCTFCSQDCLSGIWGGLYVCVFSFRELNQ